jgi:hypothetical protein
VEGWVDCRKYFFKKLKKPFIIKPSDVVDAIVGYASK